MSMTTLILKRASASRPSGEWDEDDFDVLADVGRIMKVHAAPIGSPWMWGRSPSANTGTARRHTATRRRVRQG